MITSGKTKEGNKSQRDLQHANRIIGIKLGHEAGVGYEVVKSSTGDFGRLGCSILAVYEKTVPEMLFKAGVQPTCKVA